jgi:predicted Fe-Mo cluster-binding NifX family protein
MKIAIPVADGFCSVHFGHADTFTIFDIEPQSNLIINKESIEPPPHESGMLPAWLHNLGVDILIVGGMDTLARELFQKENIEILSGAPSAPPEEIAQQYIEGTLTMHGGGDEF